MEKCYVLNFPIKLVKICYLLDPVIVEICMLQHCVLVTAYESLHICCSIDQSDHKTHDINIDTMLTSHRPLVDLMAKKRPLEALVGQLQVERITH